MSQTTQSPVSPSEDHRIAEKIQSAGLVMSVGITLAVVVLAFIARLS